MAFQVNLTNEEAWTKEIASSQSGVIQGPDPRLLGFSAGCFPLANMSQMQSWRCIKTGVVPAKQWSTH